MKRSGPLTLMGRVAQVRQAVELCAGRVPVDDARSVLDRIDTRMQMTDGYTVVALAGATGSGKSTAFNALTRTPLARASVRRPTTSTAMAAIWSPKVPHDLLAWLDVSRQHVIGNGEYRDLVLLDLPDFDSTEVEHKIVVDRLIQQVDMMVWIVDPQKYADAALHYNYLAKLSAHAGVMAVVLNRIDELTIAQVDQCVQDLRKILDSEGLRRTPIITMSAINDDSVGNLRRLITDAIAGADKARQRLAADLDNVLGALRKRLGRSAVQQVNQPQRDTLVTSLSEAVGVPIVAQGVQDAWQQSGRAATGWPLVAWIQKLKRNPLKALRVGKQRELGTGRSSLPKATPVQVARLETALRQVISDGTFGLPKSWADAVRKIIWDNRSVLMDELDDAIVTTDLGTDRPAFWWRVVTGLQWMVFAVTIVGALWIVLQIATAFLQWGDLPMPMIGIVPLPWVLVAGGVAGGLTVAGLSRVGVAIGSTRKKREAIKALTGSVAQVAQRLVLDPLTAETRRFTETVAALDRAS